MSNITDVNNHNSNHKIRITNIGDVNNNSNNKIRIS